MEWFRDNFALNICSGGKNDIESFQDIDQTRPFDGESFPDYSSILISVAAACHVEKMI